MVFNNNKKGQAAIEFLMTYGWMLLVVLIVGALIFSFVDFGSLLPNKLDLSNSLKGSPSDSIAYSGDTANGEDANEVKIVFSYVGARQASIAANSGNIVTGLGNKCYSYNISNLDTKDTKGCSTGQTTCTAASISESVTFLNGQTGIISFICDSASNPTGTGITFTGAESFKILKNDVLEGTISIKVTNPKTSLEIPSTGPIRLAVGQ